MADKRTVITTPCGSSFINYDNFMNKQQPDPAGSDCILWTGVKNNIGYPFIGIRDATGKYKMATAHRLALMLKLGRDIAPGMNANHTCHRRDCVNPQHLTEGTQQQKIRDMNADGRHVNNGTAERGSYNHKQANRTYKYSEEEITWIRNATIIEIRRKYNLDIVKAGSFRSQIRKGYKWLPWQPK